MNPLRTGKPSKAQLKAWKKAGKKGAAAVRIHGHTASGGSRTYRTWHNMIQRCRNPKNKRFKDYGGRGITVCDRWKAFANFLEDMGRRPPGKTLDRKNTNGNYEPGNCRWATPKQQKNNSRNNIRLTFHGKTKTITEWAAAIWVRKGTLMARYQRGWPVERILTEGVHVKKNKKPLMISARTCVRCLWGPYYPRNPDSKDCPKCHRPYNTPPIRNTRPENGQKGNHEYKKTDKAKRGAGGNKRHSRKAA